MKKLLLIPVLALGLAACDGEYAGVPGMSVYIEFYTDKQTGCQYLVQASGGIYQRMGADGKQICNKE